MGSDEPPTVRRRGVLKMIGVGTALGVTGINAFAGSALAWKRDDVDFKGCSEVWIIVDYDDVILTPPAAAKVIFALPDGGTECRLVEVTEENTSPIPGQYGDAPIRKVRAGEGEKILGVIIYEWDEDDQLQKPAYLYTNDHRCAMTPNTPSIKEADCYPEDFEDWRYYDPTSKEIPGNGGGGPPNAVSDEGAKTNGNGNRRGPKK